jgi:hypothetical protein
MPLLEGLRHGNRKRIFALVHHRRPLLSSALGIALANCCPLCLPVIAFYPPSDPWGFAFWASGGIGRGSNSPSDIRATGSGA